MLTTHAAKNGGTARDELTMMPTKGALPRARLRVAAILYLREEYAALITISAFQRTADIQAMVIQIRALSPKAPIPFSPHYCRYRQKDRHGF